MKIYEINIPRLFYIYHGPTKNLNWKKKSATYYCANCGHTFRSIWDSAYSFYGSRPHDQEMYCPKCGTRFIEYTMQKNYSFLADGDYTPLSMVIVLDEFKDSLRLTITGREIVSESESDYMFYERKYRETISFNIKKRETIYKRYTAGKLTSNYILGNPFDTSFSVDTNLKVLSQRDITLRYFKDFHKILKLLREKIQFKMSKKLGYKISSMYSCHERGESLLVKPIFNIAYRMIFTDLKNISAEKYAVLRGVTQFMGSSLEDYEICASYFTEERIRTIVAAKDTISGLLKVANLPDKPIFRRILTEMPFSFMALKKIYAIAQGDLNTFGNIYKCLVKYPTMRQDNKIILEQFHQLSVKWGIEYINAFIRWWKNAKDPHICADTIDMLNRLHDKINLWKKKIKPSNLHDYLVVAIYKQEHPFRQFDLNDPICRRLAMQFGSIKFYLPENSDVLHDVGKKMHNCVASYADRVYEGKTNIVLMTDDNGKLKACIEVKNNKLIQAKLFGNKPVFYEPLIQNEIIKWAKKAHINYMDCNDIKPNIMQNMPQREAV